MKGYYINLDHRTDRNSHIQQNIINKYELFSQIERMSAIKNVNGAIGCSMSHIKCLTKCLEMKDEPYFMIIEDDFCVLNEENMQEFMKEFDKISIVFITLSSCRIRSCQYLKTVNNFRGVD